jgi:hypothetical protein
MKTSDKVENVKAWLKALRSGEFVQGRHCLNKNNEKYCCLGVACAVLVKRKVPLVINKMINENRTYDECGYTLPYKAMKALGVKDSAGQMGSGDTLINLNDSGTSFKKIASLIVKNKKELFIKAVADAL